MVRGRGPGRERAEMEFAEKRNVCKEIKTTKRERGE